MASRGFAEVAARAVDQVFAAVRLIVSAQHLEERGLARAVFPTSATTCPPIAEKLTPSSARTPGNALVIARNSSELKVPHLGFIVPFDYRSTGRGSPSKQLTFIKMISRNENIRGTGLSDPPVL